MPAASASSIGKVSAMPLTAITTGLGTAVGGGGHPVARQPSGIDLRRQGGTALLAASQVAFDGPDDDRLDPVGGLAARSSSLACPSAQATRPAGSGYEPADD